jgi:hypothetical protein
VNLQNARCNNKNNFQALSVSHVLQIWCFMLIPLLIIYLANKSYSCIVHHKIHTHTHTHTHTHKMSYISNTNLYIFFSSELCLPGLYSKTFKCKAVIILHRSTDYLCPSCNSTITSNSVPLTSL